MVPAAAGRDSSSAVVSEGESTPKASPPTAFCGNRPCLYALLCLLNKRVSCLPEQMFRRRRGGWRYF